MRRELLKDEAVGKIAEDRKKEAFLKSIEDREAADDNDDDLDVDAVETQEEDSQSQQPAQNEPTDTHAASINNKRKRPLEPSAVDALNRLPPALWRTDVKAGTVNRKPSTIAEIRESVSFLIEEPDSQSATPEYGSSDEDIDPEVYVNLNRHLQAADEEEDEDLGDFIVDDSQDSDVFKKPQLPPSRAPFTERRTKANVVDRRSLLRQASSSSSTASATSKMAFFASKTGSADSFAFKAPSLLRRATTNSSFGSASSAKVSATGVSVATERGAPGQEKEVIRKGAGGRRNAVNFRVKPKEEQMKSRVTAKKGKTAKAGGNRFLGGLFSGNAWE
jgi:mediator of replication checkpoint protein 1